MVTSRLSHTGQVAAALVCWTLLAHGAFAHLRTGSQYHQYHENSQAASPPASRVPAGMSPSQLSSDLASLLAEHEAASTFELSDRLLSGKERLHALAPAMCLPALEAIYGSKLNASSLYDGEASDLALVVELWDYGQSKGDALVALRQDHPPEVSYEEGNWTVSPNTYADFTSHNTYQRYHRLVVPVDPNVLYECLFGSSEDACEIPAWYALVLNNNYWSKSTLWYMMQAQCELYKRMPCHRPLGPSSQECSGNGVCVDSGESAPIDVSMAASAELGAPYTQNDGPVFTNTFNASMCLCDAGFGDYGCQYRTYELLPNAWYNVKSLQADSWQHFKYVAMGAEGHTERSDNMRRDVIVELVRERGDPVLFAKRIMDGSVTNGLPNLSDFTDYSDKSSFVNRENYHYIIFEDVSMGVDNPDMFYVSIFNNNAHLEENAVFQLRVREVTYRVPGTQEDFLCGNDCGGQSKGTCRQPGQCQCRAGYSGKLCQGIMQNLEIQQTYSGFLAPGEIHYFRIEIASEKATKHYSMSDGLLGPIKWDLVAEFYKDGNQVIIMGQHDVMPSLQENDFSYTFGSIDLDNNVKSIALDSPSSGHNGNSSSGDQSDHMTTILTKPDLGEGVYILAVYNHKYQKVHKMCGYSLRVSLVSNVSLIYGPYIPVVLGVLVAMFLLLLTGVCWRFALRHTSIGRVLFSNNVLSARPFSIEGLGDPNAGGAHGGRGRGNAPAGLSKETIDALPEVVYSLPAGEEGAGDGDEPLCSICLGEFCKGEVLKRLPMCNHEFHKECIEKWLLQHTSCPMCRIEVQIPSGGQNPDDLPPHPHSPQGSPDPDSSSEDADVEAQDGSAAVPVPLHRRTFRIISLEARPRQPASEVPVSTTAPQSTVIELQPVADSDALRRNSLMRVD